MSTLEISSVPVILPTLERVLHADFSGLQWIQNAYTIACVSVLMVAGTLADHFGRKRVFLISIALFGVSSLLCGLAWDAPTMIAARFLQGASGGAMLICLVAVLSHQFPSGPERGRAFGTWGVILGMGLGFGPLVGGLITALVDWRWVFWVHVLLAVLTFALANASVTESRDPQTRKLDVAGMVSLSLAVFGLVFFVTQGSETGFGSARSIGALALTCVSLAVFISVAHPMFDFSVFRIRRFSGALLGSVGMNFSFWAFIVYLPIYFQNGLGQDVKAAGMSLLAYTVPTLLFPPLGERISARFGLRVAMPLGLFTIGLGFMLMFAVTHFLQANWLAVLPGCVLAGAGLGITNTPVTNTTTGAVSSERAGMASGIDMSARMIALSLNIAMMGYLLVVGVQGYVKAHLLASARGVDLRAMANAIVSDGQVRLDGASAISPEALAQMAQAALAHSFAGVMLYSAVATWLLASISFAIFRSDKESVRSSID